MLKIGLIGYGKAGQAVANVLRDEPDLTLSWIARGTTRGAIGNGAGSTPVIGLDQIKLADWLETDPRSPVVRHTRKGEDIDAVIDFRAVFQQTFDQLAYEDMPSLLKPRTGKLGLQDHEKVFCVDHKGAGNIFDMRGIDRDAGCMIVVRPDQYVAHVLPLTAHDELSAYFAAILK